MNKEQLTLWQSEILEKQQYLDSLQLELNRQKAFYDIHRTLLVLSNYFDEHKTIMLSINFNNSENRQILFSARGTRNNQYEAIFCDEIKNLGGEMFLPRYDILDLDEKSRSFTSNIYDDQSIPVYNKEKGNIDGKQFIQSSLKNDLIVSQYYLSIYDQMLPSKSMVTNNDENDTMNQVKPKIKTKI